MNHSSARIAQLESQLEVTDKLCVYLDAKVKKLEAQRYHSCDAVKDSDLAEIARAIGEIERGDVEYGLRRLQDRMDEIKAGWRQWQ